MFSKGKIRTFFYLAVMIAGVYFFSGSTQVNSFVHQMEQGDAGFHVTLLQQFLKDRGYLQTPDPAGLFGPNTELAVQKFQVDNEIVSFGTPETTGYGRVGPQTLGVLNALKNTEASSVAQIVTSFTRNLQIGATGDDVRILQEFLNNTGFTVTLTGPGSPGNESSFYGAMTANALTQFQLANNIYPADGIFTPYTRAKVIEKILVQDHKNRTDLSTREQGSVEDDDSSQNSQSRRRGGGGGGGGGNGGDDNDEDEESTVLSDETASIGILTLATSTILTQVASNTSPTACTITSGNDAGYFAVDSSTCRLHLTDAGIGNISGNYALGMQVTQNDGLGQMTVTVSTVPDRYDVSNDSQFDEVMALDAATLAGKTVAIHPGDYFTSTSTKRISKPGLSNVLTFTQAESEKPEFGATILDNTDNVTFDGIAFQMRTWPRVQSSVFRIEFGSTGLTIKNSSFRHGCDADFADCDPTATYPEFTAASGEGFLNKMASGIAERRACCDDIGDLTIENNTFTDLTDAMSLEVDVGDILITRNDISRIYRDFIQLSVRQDIPDSTTLSWNTMYLPFSRQTDVDEPHSDFMQFYADDETDGTPEVTTAASWDNISVFGNIGFIGIYNEVQARGESQGIPFMNDMPNGFYYDTPHITGNINLSRLTSYGPTVQQSKDAYMFGNTVAQFDPTDVTNASAHLIRVANAISTGHHAIFNNVVEGIENNANNFLSENVILGEGGSTIAYTTAFAGSSFAPSSVAEILAEFAPKVGGPLASGVIGAIGNGYVDFINRTIDRSQEISFVHFENLSDQAVDTTVTSNISVVRGGTNGRSISITGDASAEFRICSDAACSSVITDWSNATTTVDPKQYVQVRLTTSSDALTGSTALLTIGSGDIAATYDFEATTASGASFNTVVFEAANGDALRRGGGGLNVGVAVITPTLSGGVVTGGTITNGGQYYEPNATNTLVFTGGSGGSGAAGYAKDTDGNGVIDSVTITAGGSGYGSNPAIEVERHIQKAVIAVRTKLNSSVSNQTLLDSGSPAGVNIRTTSNDRVIVSLANLSGSMGNATLDSGFEDFFGTSTPATLICTFDLTRSAAEGLECYLDSLNVTPGTFTWNQGTSTNFNNPRVFKIGLATNENANGNFWDGDVDFVYFAYGLAALDSATGEVPDLSSAAVRARFSADNIDLDDGSGPTGRLPQLFFTGDASEWNTGNNKGSGQDFTVIGTIENR